MKIRHVLNQALLATSAAVLKATDGVAAIATKIAAHASLAARTATRTTRAIAKVTAHASAVTLGRHRDGVYTERIRHVFARKLGATVDPTWLRLLDDSISRGSWSLVRGELGRTFVKLTPTGFDELQQRVPNETSRSTTNYVQSLPIAPGTSMLFQQDRRFVLPWRPGRLKLRIRFASEHRDNLKHVQVKAFVGRRDAFHHEQGERRAGIVGDLRNVLQPWECDDYFDLEHSAIDADGDVVMELGLSDNEHIGDQAELFVQVHLAHEAANAITGLELTVSLAASSLSYRSEEVS